MRIRIPDNLTASRQDPGKVSGESRELYCGTPEYTLQPSSPPESEPAILKEPAMNELHLRETVALELLSPMTLPQQNAGIPPLSPEMDPSARRRITNRGWNCTQQTASYISAFGRS